MLVRTDTVKKDTTQLSRDDEVFAARAGQQLRDSVDELDAATLSRLNRARQVALETMDAANPMAAIKRRAQWIPVGVAAALAVVTVTLWQGQPLTPVDDPGLIAGPVIADESVDFELLLDDGELEMYAELEFFAWLPEDELENIG